jgi:hypothetical protein
LEKKAKKSERKRVQTETKVQDLIASLRGIEQIIQASPIDEKRPAFIKQLRIMLTPYRNIGAGEFLRFLNDRLPDLKKPMDEENEAVFQSDMKGASLEELRALLSNNALDKKKLLLLAEKRFNLSKGNLQKMGKLKIQDQIESAIQNIETLETIKRKAAE